MNKFVEKITELKNRKDEKTCDLEKLEDEQIDIRLELYDNNLKEQHLKKEIEDGYHRKKILENYKKLYWNKAKLWFFLFLGTEPIGIGISIATALLCIPAVRIPIIVIGIILWNLMEFSVTKMIIDEQTKEIYKIKKNYKLEEVIAKINEKEQELSVISQKNEKSKNNLNELDIHIKTLKKELKEIEEQLLTVVVLYKETFTKIIQTSKIEELKLKRQQEIDFLVNEEFEKNNIAEKYNVLNLKK